MQKILVSACLLGEKVRYDGTNKLLNHPTIIQWQEEKRIVALCPEVSDGLSVPRPPAEIQAKGIAESILSLPTLAEMSLSSFIKARKKR